MKALIIAALLLGTFQAKAEWLQATMNTLIIADWAQTRTIVNNPNIIEANPLLGREPTRKQIDAFFLTNLLLLNYAGENWMGSRKKTFYGVMTIERLLVVIHNKKIGVTINY